jgi:hypothetical protein
LAEQRQNLLAAIVVIVSASLSSIQASNELNSSPFLRCKEVKKAVKKCECLFHSAEANE